MKKFFVSFFIILIFCGVCFFIGFVQFHIPQGNYGVMVSKTSGWDKDVITPGKPVWKWEKLLPTNAIVYNFSVAPHSKTYKYQGNLPSGELYSMLLEGTPDFKYEVEIMITGTIKPELLPSIVSGNNITTQPQLDEYIDTRLQLAGQKYIAELIDEGIKTSNTNNGASGILSQKFLLSQSESFIKNGFYDLEIQDLTVNKLVFPDFDLYNTGKTAYLNYQKQKQDIINNSAELNAGYAAEEWIEIQRFAEWGKVLSDYPILIQFLAVAKGDAEAAFKAMESLSEKKTGTETVNSN